MLWPKMCLTALSLLALLPLSAGQKARNSEQTRSVIVSVVDRNGKTVRDLTKEDFRVLVHGKTATALSAHYSLAPPRVLVLLDVSGSMRAKDATPKWNIAREALNHLLEQTPPDVPIAMLTFAGQVRDVFDFSQGRPAVANWAKKPLSAPLTGKPMPQTALFDAIAAGLNMLQPFQPGDAIYAVTDGGDNRSRATASQAKHALLASGVRLFAFFFAEPIPMAVELGHRDEFLQLVEQTGGFAFGVTGRPKPWSGSMEFDYRNDKNLDQRIVTDTQELNVHVHGFWTIEVSVPGSNQRPRLKIEILNGAGKVRKDVDLVYPRVLVSRAY